ncbi:phosphoribosylamine--glycine ligase [Alicyclobacillus vulcanalis]|uniref:Phosphoribosylamine--glycine ligase n=1 Tax=Alicyclobacillus vulcanalis TaxID=252246 RepID=A0A1N7P630_9BACL|nr:phosphoribosylamine--glycine ligase [Alicyclobacillus vulcanalis]SIT06062.1 phosphoribosylamine--glycine ligase [Alicyclobacillus vulcanalis]
MGNAERRPRVLVVGQGAREHAMVWKLAQSESRPTIYAAPGNPGMAEWAELVNISASDHAAMVRFCRERGVDLVAVGPEQPLAEGLADALAEAGIAVFGPSRLAAQLEASKAFSKQVMEEAGVPTARHRTFADLDEARAYVRAHGAPIVVKADGLAAGKGVVVAETVDEAERALEDMLVGGRFGASGHRVVIEEFMRGVEVSLMYFVDAHTAVPMLPARDFKRLLDGDRGPNTGGMGAFSPVPRVTQDVIDRVTREIVQPTLARLREMGAVYRGVLYAGLMLTDEGPKVVEFNCRFGDPETEVVLPLFAGDLFEVMWAVAHDSLQPAAVSWHRDAAVCVVMASAGYPASSETGVPIELPGQLPEGVTVFHAGTRAGEGGRLETAGGRVLTVSAVAHDIPAALDRAYTAVASIRFSGAQYRHDIAHNWQS